MTQERLSALHTRSTEQIAVLLPHYRKELGRRVEELARRALTVLKTARSGALMNYHAAVDPNLEAVEILITQLDVIQVARHAQKLFSVVILSYCPYLPVYTNSTTNTNLLPGWRASQAGRISRDVSNGQECNRRN